jgi:methylthioribose-1-phosphate isomerase
MSHIQWKGDHLRLLDQSRLPGETAFVICRTVEETAEAIKTMKVRGAPAIGVVAAFGLALAAQQGRPLERAAEVLAATRPTARNLFWAIERMLAISRSGAGPARLVKEALAIQEEDIAMCRRIGAFGAELVPPGSTLLTHCNAGALATAGYGTALGVVRSAWAQGKLKQVFVDETRPLLQGARLTAWELAQEGIPHTLISDGMAGYCMQQRLVDLVVTGADRIARSGDAANKIGTYGLAVLARHHGLPFYVAAPMSTVDLSLASGGEIPIEQRDADEVHHIGGTRISPPGSPALNPAFDVTPASLITAIITDRGVLRAPYEEAWSRLGDCTPENPKRREQ